MRMIIAALLLLSVGCYSESPETRYHNLTQVINELDGEIRHIAKLSIDYRMLVDKSVLDAVKTGETAGLTEKQLKEYQTLKDMSSLLQELDARQKEMIKRRAALNLW